MSGARGSEGGGKVSPPPEHHPYDLRMLQRIFERRELGRSNVAARFCEG